MRESWKRNQKNSWNMAQLMGLKNIFVAIITSSVFLAVVHSNSSPVFVSDLHYTDLQEGYTGLLGTIEATDADGDPLKYGIQPAPSDQLGEGSGDAVNFMRVEEDGTVYVDHPVDREVFTELRAAWTVYDGTNLKVKTPPVKISITDINDNAPNFFSLPNRLDPITEDTDPDYVVLNITIEDLDEGINAIASAIITEEENVFCEVNVFTLEDVEGEENLVVLILNETLSYDEQYEYTVCLQPVDSGTPPLNGSISRVIIPVGDVQDAPPVFLNQPYDVSIPEDSELDSTVLTITAQDGDRGVTQPNQVTYQMESDKFKIDATSGAITVKEKLDREQISFYTLTVNATEEDPSQPLYQISSQTQVFITIVDVDDEPPTFTPNETSATITENAANNSPLIMELNVNDADSPQFAQFTLSLNQTVEAFRLEGTDYTSTARVDVRVKDRTFLDYEARDELTFQVIATASSGATSIAEVTVYITDENDNTPVFSKQEYTGNFTEDAAEGFAVLYVEATDDDGDNVTYSTSTSDFEVSPETGLVTVGAGSFDAELRTQYTFTVTASDGSGHSGAVLVMLECTDVNDVQPSFQRKEVQLTEEEFDSAVPNVPIGNVQASDFDNAAPNNQIVYSILSGNDADKFSVDSSNGDIYFKDTVDYEEYTEFNLTIIAEDQGVPSLSDTASVLVTILDVNDNSPQFEHHTYSFSIFENATYGVIVGQLLATDKDSSYNGEVDYAISAGSQGDFFVNSDGEIIVSNDLDRDVTARYTLTVIARDRGTPQLTDDCTVDIILQDINDKPPVFSQTQYEAEIPEDKAVNSTIITLSASDSDENSVLSFYIDTVSPYLPDQFALSEDGVLSLNQSLDFERVQLFTLGVIVVDLNTAEGESEDTAVVTITVTDVNDNHPSFEGAPYYMTIFEESSIGTVVSTDVSAMDEDEGDNAAITYSLVDDSDGRISIGPTTGILTVNGRIDRETTESLNVTIEATDGGTPALSATAQAYITVMDINDFSPVFNDTLCTDLEIFENSAENSTVCQVHADDMDSYFGSLTYSITGGNINGWFQIDTITGEISVAAVPPDREASDEVTLNINAEDPGQRQATQDVTITILDMNDNAPEFTAFTPNVDTTESTSANVTLTQVVAKDVDEENTNASVVRYQIASGNEQGWFAIDPVEGIVSTAQPLSTAAGVYSLGIVAYDLGIPEQRSPPEEMTIDVIDVNDAPPEFVYPKVYEDSENITIEYIPEGYTDIGTPLFQAIATDDDIGDNGAILYRFVQVGDSQYFTVNGSTGHVYYVGEPPDWYQKSVYDELKLEAVNYLSEAELFAQVNFEVHVLDVIDSPPYFWDPTAPGAEAPTLMLQKTENTDGEVGQVTDQATEEDSDQPVYYFIVAGNEDGLFRIEAETGVIYATEELEIVYDGLNTYELIVKVTNDDQFDPGAAILETYDPLADPTLLTVIIEVADVNNNPPIFMESLYTEGVLYTVDFDVSVAQVSTTDMDTAEENRQVVYIIDQERRINPETEQSSLDDSFSVDGETGIITTQTSFLSLTGGVYFEIVVMAMDPTKPEYVDFTNVSLSVITEFEQLTIHISDTSDNVRDFEPELGSLFEEILESYINYTEQLLVDFDKISAHTETDGRPNPEESEVLFHVIELANYAVLDAEYVLHVLDNSPSYIDQVKDTYAVDTIYLASTPPEKIDLTFFQWIILALAVVALLLLLLVTLAFYFSKKQHERILKAYGIKVVNIIPEEIGKLPGTNLGVGNPVFNNATYDDAFDDALEPEPEQSETDSNISEEAVMDMDDDEADYEIPDDLGGNAQALEEFLKHQNDTEPEYATTIDMDGFEVSDV